MSIRPLAGTAVGVYLCLAHIVVSAPDLFPAGSEQGVSSSTTAPREPSHTSLILTDEERTWLAEHPVIRVAATPDWPPFEYVDADGVYTGICADLLCLLSERIGLQIEPVTGDWPTLYNKLKAGELDVCPSMGVTPGRERTLLLTKSLLSFPHVIYIQRDEHRVSGLEDLRGRAVAVEKDYYVQEILESAHPEIRLLKVDTSLQALLKVSSGEADAYIGNTAVCSYLIDQNVIMGVKPIWCAEFESLRLSIGVRRDYGPLVGILNRAIDGLTALDKRTAVARHAVVPQWVDLTETELAWIKAHPTIRLGVDPEFAPFEFIAGDGSYQGMASDYVSLLNQRIGIQMEVVQNLSWTEATKLAETGGLDVLPCVGITEERQKHFLFSDPYLSFYRVIVTRQDGPLITGMRDLSGLRVAVQAHSSHHGFLVEHSNVPPVLFDSAERVLVAVSRGEADAAVANVATASYWIRKSSLGNLRVAAPIDEGVNNLHFAVRNDWPELVTILNKGLASITEQEAQAIRTKWVEVSVQPDLNMARVFRIVAAVTGVAGLFLGLLAVHNRRLRKEIRVRQRAEDALRRSETDYRTLVQSANSVILRMTPDGVIVFVNEFAERFFGYASDEITGRNVVGTIVPESETKGRDLRELMADLARHPENYEINENENMTKSGGRVWVAWTNRPLFDAEGDLKEILCVGADMTARKRAEEILLRYEFIVNTVDDMMSVINANGQYEAVNSAWCSAMNMSRESVLGKTLSEVWPMDVAESHLRSHLRTCLSGKLVTYESVIELPSRGQRYCEATFYPYTDVSGNVTHAVVVTHDVTDWRMAQAALKEAKQSAEAANRAKSAFLANMSHEIRTPMNAILGYTQLLQRQAGLLPDQEHALDAISRSGDHLLALINDVLEMSKIEAGRVELYPQTFDLRTLLKDMDVMFRVRTNAKGVELTTRVDESVPVLIRADESRVRQILINIVGNAVKFTDHGRIGIHVALDGAIHGAEWPLVIDVEDTGCGIAPGDLDAIFESFEQAGAAALRRGGTGLGLSISRSLARMMGGDIAVTSEPGKGSRFRFTMLAGAGNEAEVETCSPQRRVRRVRPGQGEIRVLVVDDRETNRDLLCRLLQTVGFVTREAENGAVGLEVFAEWSPQIVLIDLVMPVMSGQEAIRRMRLMPNAKATAIIAVTASTLDDERASVLARGADAFLRKPFRQSELFELIRLHANVQFDYEIERKVAASHGEPVPLESLRQAVRRMPEDTRLRLQRAVVTGSIDDASCIAIEVRGQSPELADAINKCVDELALDGLDTLLSNWGETQ